MAEQPRTDVKKKKKRKKGFTYGWPILIGVSVGILLAVFDVDLSFFDAYSLSEYLMILALFYAGIFLAINLHELGHLLVGKLLGYRFLMFRAGIFSVQKENGKLRCSIIKNVGYGGLCAMMPHEDATLKDYAFYSMGGIVMNLLTGGGFLYTASLWPPQSVLRAGLFLTGAVSVLLGIVNAFPFLSMNQPTDGMMFIQIWKNSPVAERFYTASLLMKKISSGVRPRDLQLVKGYEKIEDLHDLNQALYLYFQEMDKENISAAEQYLDEVEKNLHKAPPYSLPAYYYEILFLALLKGEREKAQRFYEKAGKILKKDQDINGLRVKAYFAYMVENDREKAADLARKGISLKEHYPFKGQAVFEEDLLIKLLETMEEER